MIFERVFEARRAWARLAGLMYLLVLVVDLAGMQMRPPLGRSLLLAGSLLTVPLAAGLYFTLKTFDPVVSAFALACRLTEAGLGVIATVTGFEAIRTSLAGSLAGRTIMQVAGWNKDTSFGTLVFTIGSTLFFLAFLRSRSIPRLLSWLGLLASLLAMAACVAHLIWPPISAMSMSFWIPMLFAEILTGGWLLIRAVDAAP